MVDEGTAEGEEDKGKKPKLEEKAQQPQKLLL